MEYTVLLSHMAYKLTQIYIIFISNIKSSHLDLYASVITCWLSTYYVPSPVLGNWRYHSEQETQVSDPKERTGSGRR